MYFLLFMNLPSAIVVIACWDGFYELISFDYLSKKSLVSDYLNTTLKVFHPVLALSAETLDYSLSHVLTSLLQSKVKFISIKTNLKSRVRYN